LTLFYLFMPLTKRKVFNLLENSKTNIVNVYYKLATKGFIDYMHQRGKKVNIWTVNDTKLIRKYKARNVDGIISDYPDRL